MKLTPNQGEDPKKPHFWNNSLRIRPPHDHEKTEFMDINASREMIYEKLLRRLDNLRGYCDGRKLIFLCDYNHGCYGMRGYSCSSYLSDMGEFLECVNDNLAPVSCSVALCGTRRADDSAILNNETFSISTLDSGIFYCATAFDFEDAYYKKALIWWTLSLSAASTGPLHFLRLSGRF